MSENTNDQDQSTATEETTKVEVKESTDSDTLGDAGKRALDAERKARKEAEKKATEYFKRIEAFEDSQRTEQQKREHELEKLRKQLDEEKAYKARVERDLLAQRVAARVGLPADLTGRLQGDDEESIEADALELKRLLVPEGPRVPRPVFEEGTVSQGTRSKGDLFADAWHQSFG